MIQIEKALGFIRGKKTYIICVLAALTPLLNLILGDISLVDFFTNPQVQAALGFAALRNGIK